MDRPQLQGPGLVHRHLDHVRRTVPGGRLILLAVTSLLLALPARAAITPAPGAVSIYPSQSTGVIGLTISYPTPPSAGTGTVVFSTSIAVTTLPAWLSVVPVPPDSGPGPVTFSYVPPPGPVTSTASFRFATTAAATPGFYTIYMSALAPPGVGTGQITLTVLPPTFTFSASPNPASIPRGTTGTVAVNTNPGPGYSSAITYSFAGFAAGITPSGAQTVNPPYPAATFTFSVAAGMTPGTYTGQLMAAVGMGTPAIATMTVIVPQPDIGVTFTRPIMPVCDGGPPVANAVVLTTLLGYTGTPTLQFTGVPAGLTVTPMNPAASAMPPAQAVPFTVSASGIAVGPHTVTLLVTDTLLGISKTVNLTVNVTAPDYTPAVSPSPLSLTAGGPARTLTASLTPNACFASTVTVSQAGAPAGVTFTPATATIAAPGFAPAGISVRASAATVPGTYPITLTFTPAAGTPKTVNATLVIAALPDFTLAVTPPSLTLQAGTGGSVSVAATWLNGLTGPITVTTPQVAGVTFAPASFTLLPGVPQTVTVDASLAAPPGATTAVFSGTASGVSGPRTDTLNLVITPPPDFTLAVVPASLTLQATTSATVAVSASALYGFAGPISVTAPTVAGVTFTPSSFTLLPGASQTVTLNASLTAPLGPAIAVFSGTAANVSGPRTATLNLTITAPPDFALSIFPPALSVPQGHSGTVTVAVTASGGFSGAVAISVAPPSGVTCTPSSFTLSPGGTLVATIAAAITAPAVGTPLMFTATATGIVGPRTATLALTVTVPTPVIEAISPPAVATGTVSNPLRLTGRDFHVGALASALTPGLIVERTTVTSLTSAEVVVSIPADSRPGPYSLVLTNPGGAPSNQGAVLLVFPATSLGAPLGVTAVAVVYPRPFTVISPKEPVFPRGLLATTGLGAIVGTWRFDGVPFDSFAVSASGGLPAEVKANVPLPISFAGDHTLELAIEQPQQLVSEPVTVVLAPESHTQLKLLAPRDGAVIAGRPPMFRWTLVPGASGYEIEIATAQALRPFRVRLAATQWRPSANDLAGLGPGAHRVRVRAVLPGEVTTEPTEWRSFSVLPERVALALEPVVADTPRGRTVLRWRGGSPGLLYRLELLAAGRVAPVVAANTFDTGYPLPSGVAGPLRVRLAAFAPDGGIRGDWNEALVVIPGTGEAVTAQEPPPVPQPAEPEAVAAPDEDGWLNWLVGAQVITVGTTADAEPDTAEANLQLSTQTDSASGRGAIKATADLGWRRGFTPASGPLPQSRNWQAELGIRSGSFRPEGRAGYSPPDFLDQSELLASGLARGGALGKLGTAAGTVSYYQSFNDSSAGTAGSLGPEQKLKAVAYEAPGDPTRFLLRAMAIRAEDQTGPYSVGKRIEAIGILGRFVVSPWLTVLLETARGESRGATDPEQRERDGWGLRLGATGNAGTLSYAVNLRKVDAAFVNPLNPGFTFSGVPDRAGADATLTKLLGRASLSLQIRRQVSGGNADSASPRAVEDGAMVNLALPLGQKVQLAASGTLTGQDGDADGEHGLPRTDRTQRGGMLTLTEMLGTASFTQSLTWQQMRDHVLPDANQTMTMAMLGANGTLAPMLTVAAMVSGTRSAGAPAQGTTEQLVASLQPSLTLTSLALLVSPRVAYTRMQNDTCNLDSASEQYQLMVQWSPSWAGSLVSLQAGADWNRNLAGAGMPTPPFQRRYTATMTLSWRAQGAPAAAPPPPLVTPSASRQVLDPRLIAQTSRWL